MLRRATQCHASARSCKQDKYLLRSIQTFIFLFIYIYKTEAEELELELKLTVCTGLYSRWDYSSGYAYIFYQSRVFLGEEEGGSFT